MSFLQYPSNLPIYPKRGMGSFARVDKIADAVIYLRLKHHGAEINVAELKPGVQLLQVMATALAGKLPRVLATYVFDASRPSELDFVRDIDICNGRTSHVALNDLASHLEKHLQDMDVGGVEWIMDMIPPGLDSEDQRIWPAELASRDVEFRSFCGGNEGHRVIVSCGEHGTKGVACDLLRLKVFESRLKLGGLLDALAQYFTEDSGKSLNQTLHERVYPEQPQVHRTSRVQQIRHAVDLALG